MHEGIFAIAQSPFDPNEVFKNVCETFIPLVEAKKIKLTYCTDHTLRNINNDQRLPQSRP